MSYLQSLVNAIPTMDTQALLLSLSICICLFAAAVTMVSRYNSHKLQKRLTEMEHSLKTANSTAIGMGQQILAMEKQLHRLSKPAADSVNPIKTANPVKPEVVSEELTTPASTEYQKTAKLDKAKALLTQGKALTDIAKICQLSFAEVSLLQALERASHPEVIRQ